MEVPHRVCGCYYLVKNHDEWDSGGTVRKYLPLASVNVHATVRGTASGTVLIQQFENPGTHDDIKELRYAFPLYEGVSVVEFECIIGQRSLIGIVKEKDEAKKEFENAVKQGKQAGLLEQIPDAADVFVTTLGNVPSGTKISVRISYVAELVHDAQVNGIRLTIPTHITPRYGSIPGELIGTSALNGGTMHITVDALMPTGSWIQRITSPSHPISVTIGALSTSISTTPNPAAGCASLTLDKAQLYTDFVLIIALNGGVGQPQAFLEEHSSLPGQRALMVTLVPEPKLVESREKAEVVFVIDRSGSMEPNVPTLRSALRTFLKSLPVGVMFNICSFGDRFVFLWEKSRAYTQESLAEALEYVETVEADMGGTKIHEPLEAAIKSRLGKMPLEILLLTDGEVWDQQPLFGSVATYVAESKDPLRIFTLGIGGGVSHALINGLARVGKGFSQSVTNGKPFEGKVVRMLEGALSPHVEECTLEVEYGEATKYEDSFELVDRSRGLDDLSAPWTNVKIRKVVEALGKYQHNPDGKKTDGKARKEEVSPTPEMPEVLHVPCNLPPLFSFNRTTAYVLISPAQSHRNPTSLLLRAKRSDDTVEYRIKIQAMEESGRLLHQLAARKVMQELETGSGWVQHITKHAGKSNEASQNESMEQLQRRAAIALGVRYQIAGKWTSFVAIDEQTREEAFIEDEYIVESESEDQDMGFGLFDDSPPPSPKRARTHVKSVALPTRGSSTHMARGGRGGGYLGRGSQFVLPGFSRVSPGHGRGGQGGGRGGSSGGCSRYSESVVLKSPSQPSFGGCSRYSDSVDLKSLSRSGGQEPVVEPPNVLHRLINIQQFDGSWNLSDVPFKEVALEDKLVHETLNSMTKNFPPMRGPMEKALATAVIIRFMRQKLQNEVDVWELVVRKAEKWLHNRFTDNVVEEVAAIVARWIA